MRTRREIMALLNKKHEPVGCQLGIDCPHDPSCPALETTLRVLEQFGGRSTADDVRHFINTTLRNRSPNTKDTTP